MQFFVKFAMEVFLYNVQVCEPFKNRNSYFFTSKARMNESIDRYVLMLSVTAVAIVLKSIMMKRAFK